MHVPSSPAVRSLVALALPCLLHAAPASAQLFADGRPAGVWTLPLGPDDAMVQGKARACSGWTDMMMAVATDGGVVNVLGAGYFFGQPFVYTLATGADFAAASGTGGLGEIDALASSRDRRTVYAGFRSPAQAGGSPIFAIAHDGTVTVAVTAAEIAAVSGGPQAVRTLAVGDDTTLFAVVDGATGGPEGDVAIRKVLRIDLDAAPDTRVRRILDAETLRARIPVPPGAVVNSAFRWGEFLAADDTGRAFLEAWVEIADASSEGAAKKALVRIDGDGSIVLLTGLEASAPDDDNAMGYFLYPALAIRNGLAWDPDTRLLVALGTGAFLYDPDVPGRHTPILQPEGIISVAQELVGDDWNNGAHYPVDFGACLASLGDGWFGSMRYVYFALGFDLDRLDYDDDGLTGAEEAAIGTDPRVHDTDGGGIGDGLERADFTDPTQPDDDRWFGDGPTELSLSDRFWGSAFRDGLAQRSMIGFVATAPDGRLRVSSPEAVEQDRHLYAFEGWDRPARATTQPGFGESMSFDDEGDVCAMDYTFKPGTWPAVCATPEGAKTTVFPEAIVDAMVGPASVATVVMTDPLGRAWVGYRGGRILRTREDGGADLVYDGLSDLVAAGYMTEDGWATGTSCTVEIGIEALVFEPVRGIPYFVLNRNVICAGGSGTAPVLAAILPDGRIVQAASTVDLVRAMGKGGPEIQGLTPDGAGGLWIVSAHLIERSLVHMDADWQLTGYDHCQDGAIPDGPSMSYMLAHAVAVAVLPDGRLFTAGALHYNQWPTTYGLIEIVPIDRKVRGGDLLFVLPGAAALGKALPEGGVVNLVAGEPLVRPVAVAASRDAVYVADAGLGAILRFPIGPDGTLGASAFLLSLDVPAGMDTDAEGRLLACDMAGNRVVRVAPDGTQEVVAAGPPLGGPTDVVALADGGFAVASATGAILRYDAAGTAVEAARPESPRSIALVTGQAWIAASSTEGRLPARAGQDGALRPLSSREWAEKDEFGSRSGGLAAAPDGTVYWLVRTGDPTTLPVGHPGNGYLVRVGTDGSAQALNRTPFPDDEEGTGDLCRVRPAGEPLPVEPGDTPPPATTDAAGGADAASFDGDAAAGEVTGGPGGGGGCASARGPSSRVALPLLLLALPLLLVPFAIRRSRRAWPAAAALALCGLAGSCSGGGSGADAPSIDARDVADGTVLPADGAVAGDEGAPWIPEFVAPACEGKTLCEPGSAPVCTGPASHRRCIRDIDGCWVRSATVDCVAGETCEDGVCVPPCAPACALLQECGDDGCGGSCGTCPSGESCCDGGFCGTCAPECGGRVCGPDGAGGSCGDCPEGYACGLGRCSAAGAGTCGDWHDCTADCPDWDSACYAACDAWAGTSAKVAATRLGSCVAARCGDCPDDPVAGEACTQGCMMDACTQEFAYCFARGTRTCRQIYECTGACAAADDACRAACYLEGTGGALYYALEWEKCATAPCKDAAPGPDLQACLHEQAFGGCAVPFKTCMGECSDDCTGIACGPNDCLFDCGACADGQSCVAGACVEPR